MKKTVQLLLVIGLLVWSAAPAGGEWPQWRGSNRDGVSGDSGLLKRWPAEGPPLVWKTSVAGQGYSSLSISEGCIFTQGARGDREFVIAIDVATGKLLWETVSGRRFGNNRGDGPRGTPTLDGDRVYALGANGDLSCLEISTGRKIWAVNLLEEFGGPNIRWGISESPLVLGDRVLVNAGGPDSSIVALNKMDGSLIWKSQSDKAGYSSAVPLEINGVTQAIFFTGIRALGVDVRDGRLLWEYQKVSNRTANIATPIVHGNRVFVSSNYGTGCALLEIKRNGNGFRAEEIYFNQNMKNHHSSSILVGGVLYGYSSAILTALRFDTGEVLWKNRSVGKGSLVYAEGHLYCFSQNGVVGLVEASPEEYREKGRFSIPQGSLPTWSHPVISDGRLYLRDQDDLYSFDIREKR